jgi:ribosome-associated heat shock protein Hsp15
VSADRIRLDKWLWHARFCKTRSQASALCDTGLIRLNDRVVRKPAQPVKPGDRLDIPRGQFIMTVEIRALGSRRGPSCEAVTLYHEPNPNGRRMLAPADWQPLLDDHPES